MKLLAINGSPRRKGNTAILLEEAIKTLPEEVEVEIIQLSDLEFGGCLGCEGCAATYQCVVKDDMKALYPKIIEADGLILGSPTYFYNVSSLMKAFIERLYPFELFDEEDRHVWVSGFELFGFKYAVVMAICEQLEVKDMGFTMEAMAMPLEALGYRVVEKVAVLNLFKKGEVRNHLEPQIKATQAVEKLYKTIRLAHDSKKSLRGIVETKGQRLVPIVKNMTHS